MYSPSGTYAPPMSSADLSTSASPTIPRLASASLSLPHAEDQQKASSAVISEQKGSSAVISRLASASLSLPRAEDEQQQGSSPAIFRQASASLSLPRAENEQQGSSADDPATDFPSDVTRQATVSLSLPAHAEDEPMAPT